MDAEFEEKTYEQHLISELVRGREFFSPGQCLEDTLGFDVGLSTAHPVLWAQFPNLAPWWRRLLRMPPAGIKLEKAWWAELEEDFEYFPKFKFNSFIQAKRPQRMVRADASEYSSWGQPYFRYSTFQAQQAALESLMQNAGGRALVVYACPAFFRYSELWNSVYASRLVDQSNFAEVLQLSGHSRYTFLEPGTFGIAYSEPTPIQSTPFRTAIERLSRLEPTKSNVVFLSDTASAMAAVPKSAQIQELLTSVTNALYRGTDSQLAKSLATVYAFQFVFAVRLLIGI
jgi:hypothetical protein